MSNERFIDWLRGFVAADEYRRLPAEELWLRVRNSGDENAFHEVVERLGPRVLQICRGVLFDRHLAEDAFQETFLRLAQRRHSIPTFVNARAWVRTAARLTAHHLRRGRRRKTNREQSLVDVGTETVRPESDEFDRLSMAMQELPERYRRPLELVYWDGLTHSEAAMQLGWSKGTVDSYVSRGLEKLRAKLGLPTVAVLIATLSAPAPAVTPMLFAALAGPLPAVGWNIGKLLLVNVLLVGAGAVGWGMRERMSNKAGANPMPIVQPHVAQIKMKLDVSSVPEKNLRIFRKEVEPVIIDSLKSLFDEGAVRIESVDVYDSRLVCDVELSYRPGGVKFESRMMFSHDSATGETRVEADPLRNGNWRDIDSARPVVLYRDPLFNFELTIGQSLLGKIMEAFKRLPQDNLSIDAATDRKRRLVVADDLYIGVWLARGDRTKRCAVTARPDGSLDFLNEAGEHAGSSRGIWVGPDGRLRGVVAFASRVVLSADGTRLQFIDSPKSEWWERVSKSESSKLNKDK